MIIATRILKALLKSGQWADVRLQLHLPTMSGDEWECTYEIDWPSDGWPARTVKGRAVGSDALHALQLGIQKLGVELHMTSYHRERKLRWGDWNGYGIALPKEGRDLMQGDDAKFYG
ncbi:hypothetical protein [Devosia sp.]|uniref:DUF6968 family protein n=1 Tax=Devosia sp. TaxID=1871048 RepID=UPI001AC202D1|nr:hypothetical protein [Devosia sp.]MBN9308151.1 hypothetical protein [Devosia sp.]